MDNPSLQTVEWVIYVCRCRVISRLETGAFCPVLHMRT